MYATGSSIKTEVIMDLSHHGLYVEIASNFSGNEKNEKKNRVLPGQRVFKPCEEPQVHQWQRIHKFSPCVYTSTEHLCISSSTFKTMWALVKVTIENKKLEMHYLQFYGQLLPFISIISTFFMLVLDLITIQTDCTYCHIWHICDIGTYTDVLWIMLSKLTDWLLCCHFFLLCGASVTELIKMQFCIDSS